MGLQLWVLTTIHHRMMKPTWFHIRLPLLASPGPFQDQSVFFFFFFCEFICLSTSFSFTRDEMIYFQAGYGTFLAASLYLPTQGKALTETITGFNSRRVLNGSSMEHSVFGQWLGWLMAAIYMGGRLPQIWLNVSVKCPLNFTIFISSLFSYIINLVTLLIKSTFYHFHLPD